MRLAIVAALLVALGAAAGTAAASESQPTLPELEKEIICPTCHTTLELSNAPIADRIRAFIRARIAAGDTKSEIKSKLVAQFGESVLAAPPKRGFNLRAWLLPLAGIVVAAVTVGLLARRWTRARPEPLAGSQSPNGRAPLDPELEQRLDEELARFEG
jgi:cytochrome c-type biogenesis protein CcmH